MARYDFNGDGRSDILWRNDNGIISDWLGAANGGFVNNDANALTSVSTDWIIIGVGDFNGDGRSDLLWRHFTGTGEISDWLGVANGGFIINDANAFQPLGFTSQVRGIGDFNGDGRDDLLIVNTLFAQTSVRAGATNGGFTSLAGHMRPLAGQQITGVGDFNGDGKDDLLWRDSATGALVEWSSNGDGTFTVNANGSTSVPIDWHVVGVGDFNGDHRDDLLWRNDNGALSDWLGNPNGSFTINDANAFVMIPTNWGTAKIGDYNGDGRDDILWRDANGQMSDWLGTPSGGFAINDANAFVGVSTDWHTVGTSSLSNLGFWFVP